MGANANTIDLRLVVKDDGSVTIANFAGGVEHQAERAGRAIRTKISGAFRSLSRLGGRTLASITRQVFSLKGALLGLGVGAFGKSVVDTASGFEQMKLSLDTITKGHGEEWFRKLNEWALTMPVNTKKAIQSFTMMRAMGLQPTIAQMTTLVDTMSALGGSEDTLEGMARALGQMATKGKVSAEELMQLAERGVPVFEILKEKFGEVDTASIKASDAINAIFEGLEERYGGQSRKIQSTWKGLTESLKSYWTEFVRLVMDSGVMQWLEEQLGKITGKLQEWYSSGKLREWAQATGKKLVEWFEKIKWKLFDLYSAAVFYGGQMKGQLDEVIDTFKILGGWVRKIDGWLSSLDRFRNKLHNALAPKFEGLNPVLEPGIKMSPPQPWKSGIKEMHQDIAGLAKTAKTVFPANNFIPRESPLASIRTGFGIPFKGGVPITIHTGYRSGTDYVPRTGPYWLHQGEQVVPAGRGARTGMTVREVNINIGAQAQDAAGLARRIRAELMRLDARGA